VDQYNTVTAGATWIGITGSVRVDHDMLEFVVHARTKVLVQENLVELASVSRKKRETIDTKAFGIRSSSAGAQAASVLLARMRKGGIIFGLAAGRGPSVVEDCQELRTLEI